MKKLKSQWYEQLLACPLCKGLLTINSSDWLCRKCNFQAVDNDFRPGERFNIVIPKSQSVLNLDSEIISRLRKIDTAAPEMIYKGPLAMRDSTELMSEIMRQVPNNSNILDLGCGPRDQYEPVKSLGHNYVGIDYSSDAADLLADAHFIPFQSSSFECVLSYAVLEHMYNPMQAVAEIERVLKPGGKYIGTVSQGEPFHDSFFHLTPWGLLSLINATNSLRVKKLWATRDTLSALSTMGKYPKVILILLKFVDKLHKSLPLLAPRKLRWSQKDIELDFLFRSGSIGFVVEKNFANRANE